MEENEKIEFEIEGTQEPTTEPSVEETPVKPEAKAKKRRFRVADFFAGRVLASNKVVKQLPLALMVLVYSFSEKILYQGTYCIFVLALSDLLYNKLSKEKSIQHSPAF